MLQTPFIPQNTLTNCALDHYEYMYSYELYTALKSMEAHLDLLSIVCITQQLCTSQNAQFAHWCVFYELFTVMYWSLMQKWFKTSIHFHIFHLCVIIDPASVLRLIWQWYFDVPNGFTEHFYSPAPTAITGNGLKTRLLLQRTDPVSSTSDF